MEGFMSRKIESTRTALGALSLMDIEKALQEGKRVDIMLGRLENENGDKDAAWIGTALAEVCVQYKCNIAVRDTPGLIWVGLELSRRVRRIEKEGHPYGAEMGIKVLGSESPYRGINLTDDGLRKCALTTATAVMESYIWGRKNLWPIFIQLTNLQTMFGFLAGYETLQHDETGRPLLVDAAVAFLDRNGSKSCGYIRSFKDEALALGLTPSPKPKWLD